MESKNESIILSCNIDIFLAEENLYQPILNSIRRYRAACRQMYAALVAAEAAGSTIEANGDGLRVKPTKEAGKQILSLAMGKEGKALAYELRDWFLQDLYPSAMSFVWDSARRDVQTVYTSGDPEFPKASRGWLALQGARRLANFNWRGIGFPVATARPKLEKHSVILKWDHEIGAVEFKLPKLDGGRYFVWKNLRDKTEGWKLGTLFLNERDGSLRISLSYSRPRQIQSVDEGRILTVSFGEDQEYFLKLAGPDGATTFDTISAAESVGWLSQMEARKIELERRRAACGAPSREWGDRKTFKRTQEVISRLTKQRSNGVLHRNHQWTRRIVSRAASWRCGVIAIEEMPESLFGKPWQWSQFIDLLRYKTKDKGITVRTPG